MWFVYFQEFERKRKKQNRLVIGVYNLESGEKRKIFVRQKVRVPTRFLSREQADDLESRVKSDDLLSKCIFEKPDFEDYKHRACSIVIPYDEAYLERVRALISSGSQKFFQLGAYDKLLKFSGVFPDRLVEFNANLEKRLNEKEPQAEIELDSFDDFNFKGFIDEDQLSKIPRLYIDIEKPLWKRDEEKVLLDERGALLKEERMYQRRKEVCDSEKEMHEERLVRIGKRIREIEDKMSIDVPGFGNVKLYDEKFDARISFVSTIWKDREGKEIKEVYVLDPKGELKLRRCNNYRVFRFDSEEKLLQYFIKRVGERKPLISVGHNQVYDITQIRYGADELGLVFDPAVEDVRPKRDFVQHFIQRLRQDMIYLDTLWFANIISPHLKQRRFGSSLKLEGVATSRGISFEKDLSHDELRVVELNRLDGLTKEARGEAAKKLLEYATKDLIVTKEIFESMPFFSLICKMKGVLPFCSLSEIAFFPNCVGKLHELRHFEKHGNIPYYGFSKKNRVDEERKFMAKFGNFKDRRLRENSALSRVIGDHSDVQEYYFSLEEAVSQALFSLSPKLEETHGWARHKFGESRGVGKDIFFGFLSYLRKFANEVFFDYYCVKEKILELRVLKEGSEQHRRVRSEKRFREWVFSQKYGFDFMKVYALIVKAYQDLGNSLKSYKVVDFRGDYIFIKDSGKELDVPHLYLVRSLGKYTTK